MTENQSPASILQALDWTNEPMVIRPDMIDMPRLDKTITAWVARAGSDSRLHDPEIISSSRSLRVFFLTMKTGQRVAASLDNPKTLVQTESKITSSRSSTSTIEVPCPDGMRFLPFQLAGIEYARTHHNLLIADEMGLGKTIQAIGIHNDMGAPKRVLVVCPAYLKLNWRKEFIAWMIGSKPIKIVDSKTNYAPEAEEIVIINYEILKKHMTALRSKNFDLLIVDEAHFIKSPDAQRTKAVAALRASRKIALTGTPALNRPIELYPIISLLMGKEAPQYWTFARTFCGAKKGPFGMDVRGCSNPFKLQQMLRSTIMVRRLKKDVLKELPPKQRQIIELPPTGKIRMILDMERQIWAPHEETIAALRLRRDEAELADDDETFQEMAKAISKQIAIGFTEMAKIRVELSLHKAPLIAAHLNDVMHGNQDKFIVFFHHKQALHLLAEEMREHKPLVITGDVPVQERNQLVEAFQGNPEHRLIIGTIGAMGTGVTLTASSTVIMAELDWRPGILAQAEDRAHRIGQRDSVLCQYFLFEDSVDSKMISGIIHKMENLGRCLDGSGKVETEAKTQAQPKKRSSGDKEWKTSIAAITPELSGSVLAALKLLASMDTDMARFKNNKGFSRFDAGIGHRLASKECLPRNEAAFALHLLRKYHRQLPRELALSLWGGEVKKFDTTPYCK